MIFGFFSYSLLVEVGFFMVDISHIKVLMETQQSLLCPLGLKGRLLQKSIRMQLMVHGYR